MNDHTTFFQLYRRIRDAHDAVARAALACYIDRGRGYMEIDAAALDAIDAGAALPAKYYQQVDAETSAVIAGRVKAYSPTSEYVLVLRAADSEIVLTMPL